MLAFCQSHSQMNRWTAGQTDCQSNSWAHDGNLICSREKKKGKRYVKYALWQRLKAFLIYQ